MEERRLTRRAILTTAVAGITGLGYGHPTDADTSTDASNTSHQPHQPKTQTKEQNANSHGTRTTGMSEDDRISPDDSVSEDESASEGEGYASESNGEDEPLARISPGDQIRIGTSSETASYPSVLSTVPDEEIGEGLEWVSDDIRDRLGVDEEAELFVQPYAPHPEYTTRDEAKAHDEFVEYLVEHGETPLAVTAPHGGRIEYRTDEQARQVATTLDATEWGCFGYNEGGGAYKRCHITSTELSCRSFPRLDSISDRDFEHAVSFHGFTKDGIAIGGGAPQDLKERFRDAIDDATEGAYDVYIPEKGTQYAGTSSDNFVNWLPRDGNGIQIEQCRDARVDDYEKIADAVVSVYRELLD